jgi:hypothetical protein
MRRRSLLHIAAAGIAAPRVWAQPAQPKRLLFVHGRSQGGRSPQELKSEWLSVLASTATTLGRSLSESVAVEMPFYGDKLDQFAGAAQIPLSSDIQTRGSDPDREFQEFQAEFADSLRKKAGVTDDEIQAEYGGVPSERGPQNWRWVQAILRALDKKVPGMGAASLEAFTRDVFLYVTKPGVRTAIDGIVSAGFSEDLPTVVVAHSLGTVVTYSILAGDRRRLRVPLLLTLGSPLAVRAVRDPFRPLAYPTAIQNWYNAFDRRDVVSLYPLDQDNFPVGGSIVNNDTVKNQTDNRHGIAGYLNDPAVVTRILDALSA